MVWNSQVTLSTCCCRNDCLNRPTTISEDPLVPECALHDYSEQKKQKNKKTFEVLNVKCELCVQSLGRLGSSLSGDSM